MHTPKLLAALGALALLLSAGARLQMAGHREFDPDELQHLHAAWCVSQGLVPYRDFYEHHMPGLPLALAATVPMPARGAPVESALNAMRLARIGMWVCLLGIIGVSALVGAHLAGPAGAVVTAILLTLGIVFTGKGLEVRPDTPATLCWIGSVWLLLVALERGRHRRWIFFASGLLLGAALLFTQKLLFAGPGLAVVSVWAWLGRDAVRSLAERVMDTAAQLTGMLLPVIATLAWFASQGAARTFLEATLLQNVGWIPETTARNTLEWVALRDPVLLVLGLAGIVRLVVAMRRKDHRQPARVAIASCTLSLLAGLFVIPTPYPQYLVPVFPLLAAAGAWLLVDTGDRPWSWWWGTVAAAFALTVVWARPVFIDWWAYPATFGVGLLLAGAVQRRSRPAALCVVIALSSLYPAQQLRWMAGLSNEQQLDALAVVHQLTAGARDTVLDGFSGLGWFRMHAWRPHFLHGGVRARLSRADRAALADAIRSGRIHPGAVLLDEHLLQVDPDVVAAIRERYSRTDTWPVWKPKALQPAAATLRAPAVAAEAR